VLWNQGFLLIGTHVDDLFVLFNRAVASLRDSVMKKLRDTMEVTDKGEISFALDMKIERDRENGILKISQQQFTENLLREYNIHEGDTTETPSPVIDITDDDVLNTEEEKEEMKHKPIRELIGKRE